MRRNPRDDLEAAFGILVAIVICIPLWVVILFVGRAALHLVA